ncbi:YopJ family acetyltransferase [Brenneria goodwinii]|uniref:Avirulence protein n=1 Tax=Brenneria goodwinii TaxID=1109412 RepID=A0A0G4JW18_9GAMM|nr:YopJ family acetyltransferase [Brenneria goodwinii]CPR17249.1 avirulence protein [Brenneria goodwinii]
MRIPFITSFTASQPSQSGSLNATSSSATSAAESSGGPQESSSSQPASAVYPYTSARKETSAGLSARFSRLGLGLRSSEGYNPRQVTKQLNNYLNKLESHASDSIQPNVRTEESALQKYLIMAQNDKHHLQIGLLSISATNGDELKNALRMMDNNTKWRAVMNIADDDEPNEPPHSVAVEAEKKNNKISLVVVDAYASAFTDSDIAEHITDHDAALTVLFTSVQKSPSGCKIFSLHDVKAMASREEVMNQFHQRNYAKIDDGDYDKSNRDTFVTREFKHQLPADFYRLTTSQSVFNSLPEPIKNTLRHDFNKNLNTRITYENHGVPQAVTYNTAIEDQRMAFARDTLQWLGSRR